MKKTSGKNASTVFNQSVTQIDKFLKDVEGLPKASVPWAYDYAIIRLHRELEQMTLKCLVAAINNDTKQLSNTTGIDFPKHLTHAVCEYIIIGDGYFDTQGRDSLIRTLKKYLRNDHYLVKVFSETKYKCTLDRLYALRNFAAHGSLKSRKRALTATSMKKLPSSGGWLKVGGRFKKISDKLVKLANEIHEKAPY